MKIILARHGRPDLPLGTWVAPGEMREWLRRYDQAAVDSADIPTATRAAAASAGVVMSSTLPRCMQSARHLGREFLVDELFREADLPHPAWPLPRLPMAALAMGCRLAWFWGYAAGGESRAQARERAGLAAGRLADLAREHGSVFLMGHGIMALLIARHLSARGWNGPRRPTHRYWQFSVYHAPD